MKFILLALTFFLATNGYALDQEIDIKRSNSALPTTKVKIHNGMVSWSVYKSSDTDYVILSGLNEKDALNMLSIAEKAHATYDQIKAVGRCPTNSIRSDSLGEISSFSRSKMGFEVVCEKNNILLKITMHDKYVVSLINSRVEASDLTKLANSVLNELRKH